FQPVTAERFQYPGKFAWPTRIFFLDRCFVISRFALQNGKHLIIINTHNSAYDETGEVKKAEMEFLRDFVISEYVNGNYVVVGGDFNQRPPKLEAQKFSEVPENTFIPPGIDRDFMPSEWYWVYDPFVPTNRHLDTPLQDDTYKTVIDYYLVSPNVEVTAIRTLDLQFQNSDHQPVIISIRLK
ncbi:MAG: endonuclease/exonuclease/phosphatase family protein, partial [Chitinophagales bacterium]